MSNAYHCSCSFILGFIGLAPAASAQVVSGNAPTPPNPVPTAMAAPVVPSPQPPSHSATIAAHPLMKQILAKNAQTPSAAGVNGVNGVAT